MSGSRRCRRPLSLPVWVGVTRLPADQPLFIYGVVMAVFIIYCHRANIARMRARHRESQSEVEAVWPEKHERVR